MADRINLGKLDEVIAPPNLRENLMNSFKKESVESVFRDFAWSKDTMENVDWSISPIASASHAILKTIVSAMERPPPVHCTSRFCCARTAKWGRKRLISANLG
jgi:hypothetical protein